MPSKHQRSPTRKPLPIQKGITPKESGVNPEAPMSPRTIELATDQSIAARHLLYYPNDNSLAVVGRCADGINSIMNRLAHTNDKAEDLAKDEILISMCTRLMADGGTGRIIGFNKKLAELVDLQKKNPKSDEYTNAVQSLADDCRKNMSKITTNAKKSGLDGALARQGLLSFMGDLGGLEATETGFGAAYKGPLCKPDLVYNTYIAGLCDAQRKLTNKTVPATNNEMESFKTDFEAARKATSLKGGVLSAPMHTAGKKQERAPVEWTVYERQGLLNTGDIAENKLKELYPNHKKQLVDASWPSFVISKEVTQDVVEPLTGHVSGTFGEMATTMNMLCGTPPGSVSRDNPSGKPLSSASEGQTTAIAALSSAGLITAGFHSAVEIFQPMSTFTTHSTTGSLGPTAVAQTQLQAEALRDYAAYMEKNKTHKIIEYDYKGYKLTAEELKLDKEHLLSKAESLEDAATKSVDMISALQGEGGTIATLDVSRVMANHSTNPKAPVNLYSLSTRLEELGQGGYTETLEKARKLAESPFKNIKLLDLAITAAEAAASARDLRDAVTRAQEKASEFEAIAVEKEQILKNATQATDEAAKIGWGKNVDPVEASKARANMDSLEAERKKAFAAAKSAREDATIAKSICTDLDKVAQAAEDAEEQAAILAEAESAAADAESAVAEAEKVISASEKKETDPEADLSTTRETIAKFKERVKEAKSPTDEETPGPSIN